MRTAMLRTRNIGTPCIAVAISQPGKSQPPILSQTWFANALRRHQRPMVDIRSEPTAYLGRMATREDRIALLQGTLDLLILRTLVFGPEHGQGIARAIQQQSEEVLLVDHGTLYPALQRLEAKGWIDARWSLSSNNRRARFYTLTKAGRKQLVQETSQWKRLAAAIGRILGPDVVEE